MAGSSGSLHESEQRSSPRPSTATAPWSRSWRSWRRSTGTTSASTPPPTRSSRQSSRTTATRRRSTPSMTLEWLRRHDPKLDEHLRTYLFTDKPLLEIEHEAEEAAGRGRARAATARCGIGSLRDRELRHERPVARARADFGRGLDARSTPRRRARSRPLLAARRLVDFNGPLGWDAASRRRPGAPRSSSPPLQEGVARACASSLPLIELRVPFELVARGTRRHRPRRARRRPRSGARMRHARRRIAEDRAIFQGYAAAGIRRHLRGVGGAEPDDSREVRRATRTSSPRPRIACAAPASSGPYGIALGPRCYTGLTRSTERGYPIINHVRELLDGPIVLGARRGRRGRAQPARRRLRADGRPGLLDRLSRSHQHLVLLYLQETLHVSRAVAGSGRAADLSRTRN